MHMAWHAREDQAMAQQQQTAAVFYKDYDDARHAGSSAGVMGRSSGGRAVHHLFGLAVVVTGLRYPSRSISATKRQPPTPRTGLMASLST